jgi:hypothetical protein
VEGPGATISGHPLVDMYMGAVAYRSVEAQREFGVSDFLVEFHQGPPDDIPLVETVVTVADNGQITFHVDGECPGTINGMWDALYAAVA